MHKYLEMKLINVNIKLLFLAIVVLMPAISFAVTQKDMEQAQTIAAKAYLRYANDGSGYLDEINPTTMAELEAALKTKEKENLKAFKAIPFPADYKDWNKEKLVEFWAVTAFQNKDLLEKGRGGRIRARNLINKMTLETPAQAAAPKAESAPTASSPVNSDTISANPAEAELNALNMDQQALEDSEEAAEDEFMNGKESNYTWVYIMVLAILVGIVIALVVYAANVLKKNNGSNISSAPDYSGSHNEADLREDYETAIADKNMEIAMLKKKLESANRQNNELQSSIEQLKQEISALKSASAHTAYMPAERQEVNPTPSSQKSSGLRTIYLGRANSRGIFVRADRNINPLHTIFQLETSDGYSGSFSVVDSMAVWNLALSNPKEYLEAACICHNLDNPGNAERIVTESSGTAVFEGGCWRVIRKSRIRYE